MYHTAYKHPFEGKVRTQGYYRKTDPVGKAFSHLKQHLDPFFSRAVNGKGAMLSLTLIGYTMIAMTASKCHIPYCYALKIISGIRRAVYSCGVHDHMKYTKERSELTENLKIDL